MRLLTTMRAAALGLLIAFPTTMPTATAQEQTLFEKLGGQAGIEAAVDQFLTNVAGDERINRFFANADLARLRGLLVEQICAAAGGPCVYTGRSMREVHAGLGITDADFAALVEDLSGALDTVQVPPAVRDELLGLLAPMQADIVQAPALVPGAPATAVPVADPPSPGGPAPAVPVAAPPAPATPGPAPAAVAIQNFAFNPTPIRVAAGGAVTWTNRDSVSHTATGSDFNTGLLSSGQSRSITFASPGRFAYQCAIHSTMRGEVVVQ